MTPRKLELKKVIIAIPIAMLVLGAAYHFWPKAYLLYTIYKNVSKEKTPNIYLTPTYRNVHSTSLKHLKSVEISTDFIRLKVPWSIKQQFNDENLSTFVFHEKKLISIYNKLNEEKIIAPFLNGAPDKVNNLKELIGVYHLRSDFDFIRLCLHTTPDQATFFTPNKMLVRIKTVLLIRAIYEPQGGNIFEFNLSNGLKGFQFGEIGDKKTVEVHLFNDERQLFEIHFMSATQAEIDFVLSSIELL
jgi:hypothetical protein